MLAHLGLQRDLLITSTYAAPLLIMLQNGAERDAPVLALYLAEDKTMKSVSRLKQDTQHQLAHWVQHSPPGVKENSNERRVSGKEASMLTMRSSAASPSALPGASMVFVGWGKDQH